MKLVFLDSNPQFKCGAAAFGAVVAVVSAVAAMDASRDNVEAQLDAQREENETNRQFSSAEAEKARQYNTGERLASEDYQKELIAEQNEYNLPSSQAERLRDAGLNPSLALGSSHLQSISATGNLSSPASSPSPSFASGLSPVQFQPLDLQVPALAESVSSIINAESNAARSGVDTKYLTDSMHDRLEALQLDNASKKLLNKQYELDTYVKDRIKDVDVRRAYYACNQQYYDAMVSLSTVGKVDNESKLLESQKRLNDVLSSKEGAEYDLLKLRLSSYTTELNSVLRLQQSQVDVNKASARQSNALASFQEFTNKMRNNFSVDEYNSYLSGLVKSGLLSDAEAEEARRRAELIKGVRGNVVSKSLDAALEYIKEKLSILKIH